MQFQTGFYLPLPSAYEAVMFLKGAHYTVTAPKEVIASVLQSSPKFTDETHPKLFAHQRSGSAFLRARTRALLADEMGVGKTPATLAAIDKRFGALVVCPPVMLGTWWDEARKWRPDLTSRVWKAPYPMFPEPGELTIASYSQLPVDDVIDDPGALSHGFHKPKWTGVRPHAKFGLILDEAHYLKNAKTKRTRVIRAIAGFAHYMWMLTGTPVLNRPPELWALLQTMQGVAKDVFGSWDEFAKLFGAVYKRAYYMSPPRDVIDHWGETPPSEARARLQCVMMRRTRQEVLPSLPTKTYRDIKIEVKPKDMREMGGMGMTLGSMTDDEVLEQCGEAGEMSRVRAWLASAKIATMMDVVEEYEETETPLVVFSHHREPIMRLGERKGWRCITGSTSDYERSDIVRAFQSGELKGLAGTIGAMGVGVTLTRASNMLFVDQSYVPAENLQAEDRECRIGQKNAVTITRLVSNHPVDTRVSEILDKKMMLLEGLGLQ